VLWLLLLLGDAGGAGADLSLQQPERSSSAQRPGASCHLDSAMILLIESTCLYIVPILAWICAK